MLAGASFLTAAGRDRIEDAVALNRKALELRPDSLDALNNLAWLVGMELDRPGEALETYANPGLKLYPNDPHLLDTCGALLIKVGDYPAARARLEKCLPLTTHLPTTRCSTLLSLGRVYMHLKEDSPARRSLLEARDIDRTARALSDAQRAEVDRLLASLGN
jgi:tetratricopeptide (TPR) repeat protein